MADDPYHLRQPDLASARAAVFEVYGPGASARWDELLGAAGLSGRETSIDAVRRLAEVMMASDPVTALSGRSLLIRVNTYEYLLAASDIIAGNPS
jgi:hypothetical protein